MGFNATTKLSGAGGVGTFAVTTHGNWPLARSPNRGDDASKPAAPSTCRHEPRRSTGSAAARRSGRNHSGRRVVDPRSSKRPWSALCHYQSSGCLCHGDHRWSVTSWGKGKNGQI